MKIRQSVKEKTVNYNAGCPNVPISLSIGFATMSTNCDEFWEVVKEADYNMYQEKRSCQENVYRKLRSSMVD